MLVAPQAGKVQAFNHLDRGDTFEADVAVGDATPGQFDAIVLPGGVANPDMLRTVPAAVELVRAFVESGRPVGVICHGRKPDDLPAFGRTLVEHFGRQEVNAGR